MLDFKGLTARWIPGAIDVEEGGTPPKGKRIYPRVSQYGNAL